MKILVTGGCGFIGSHIVDTLIDSSHEVHVIDNLSTGKLSNLNKQANFHELDITDKNMESVFAEFNPDVVIHHAAQIDVQASIKRPDLDANVNILGTINVLDMCRKYDVRKIIYASSAAIYGNPNYLPIDEDHVKQAESPYGVSKFVPEMYIRLYSERFGLKYTILRYANVYGERQDASGEGGVVSIFADRLKENLPLTIFGDGQQTRDFIYVKDVAKANLMAVESADGETFNISTGQASSINELYDVMSRVFGKSVAVSRVDPRSGDIMHSYLCNAYSEKCLAWKPEYNLEDGLKAMCLALK